MYDYERLAHLAGLYGVERQYYDIWGNLRGASEETFIAVLAAMGVRIDSPESLDRAVADAEDAPWLRPLEPVHVRREGADAVFEVSVPARLAAGRLSWRFVHEDGMAEEGTVVPAEFGVTGARAVRGEEYVRHGVSFPVSPGIGYHRLELSGAVDACSAIIVTPAHCYTPEALMGDGRVWGVTVQLYSLRSATNWGIGDFTDLGRFIQAWAGHGASMVGINPLHALFVHNPEEYSPYYPSSRRFINVMYIDPCAVDDFAECAEAARLYESEEFRGRLARARESGLVDNSLVYPLKLEMMGLLYECFREKHLRPGTARAREFEAFVESHGDALRRHSLFEALQEKFTSDDPSVGGWMNWPEEYRDPDSGAVAVFARENEARTGFYSYLQWQAFVQLDRAGGRSAECGLKVGIYQDLAVGCSANGAEVWSDKGLYGLGISVGAPPDGFNLMGQSWGLPPMIPSRLREEAYAPFIDVIQCSMRDAGALRLDHIIGLMRLFWVPADRQPTEGTYVHYPMEELMGIVALESVRNRCLVIGEDLGTVPPEVPALMQAMDMLSFRVFYWEMDHTGGYRPPRDYPRNALVTVGTHDLPTLAGYWEGLDVTLRSEQGAFPSYDDMERQVSERGRCRREMLGALEREGLLPEEARGADPACVPQMTEGLSAAIHRYLARSVSKVMVVQLEDATGSRVQVNMPGTDRSHPNWRRRVDVPVEEMFTDPRIRAFAGEVRSERG